LPVKACRVDVDAAWDDIKTFISINEATLQITGSAIRCKLMHRHGANRRLPDHMLGFQSERQYVYLDVSCDREKVDQTEDERAVLCVLVGISGIGDTAPADDSSDSDLFHVQWALVLQELDSGQYNRIGVSELDGRKEWFKNAPVVSITVIQCVVRII
jgi:hypothetical protein